MRGLGGSSPQEKRKKKKEVIMSNEQNKPDEQNEENEFNEQNELEKPISLEDFEKDFERDFELELEKKAVQQVQRDTDKKFGAWIHAMRLRTLPLSLSGLAIGASCATLDNKFSIYIFLLSLVTGLCLQILSNFANDYGDAQKGTDGADRVGPLRTVASGLISQKEMLWAIKLTIAFTIISAVALFFVSFGLDGTPWLVFGILTILSVVAALAYTMGENPYGYSGKGDLFVFIFFGLVAVLGSYSLYGANFYNAPIFPAVAAGLLSTAVLNVNNIRDMKSDAFYGKNTFALSLGEEPARQYHLVLVSTGLLMWMAYLLLMHGTSSLVLLVFAAPVVYSAYTVYHSYNSKVLDVQLKITAMGIGGFHILLSIVLPLW